MKHVINEGGGHVWPFLDVMIPKRLLKILLNPENIFFWPFHRRLVFISTLSIILKFAVQWKIGLNSEAKVPLEFVFSWVWWRELGERGDMKENGNLRHVWAHRQWFAASTTSRRHFPENNFHFVPFEGFPTTVHVLQLVEMQKHFVFENFGFVLSWEPQTAKCCINNILGHLDGKDHSLSQRRWHCSLIWPQYFTEFSSTGVDL